MNSLFRLNSTPPSDVGYVAVAINDKGLHVALLYRLNDGRQMRMLHLGWDHDLRDEDVSTDVADTFVAISLVFIGPLRSKAIAHYCLTVFEANREGIPYAFGDPRGSFDTTGKFIAGSQRVGLTCASFVLAVLEQAGVSIVDRNGWGPNQDDPQFFKWSIQALKGEISGIPPAKRQDHVSKIESQIAGGAVRYRPLEVAGAATSSKIPVAYADAVQLGEQLKIHLTRSNEIPPYMT